MALSALQFSTSLLLYILSSPSSVREPRASPVLDSWATVSFPITPPPLELCVTGRWVKRIGVFSRTLWPEQFDVASSSNRSGFLGACFWCRVLTFLPASKYAGFSQILAPWICSNAFKLCSGWCLIFKLLLCLRHKSFPLKLIFFH